MQDTIDRIIRDALKLYRANNPQSRATDHTTWYGSGSAVRRATCIYCRKVVATSSAKYPETKCAAESRVSHGRTCAMAYAQQHAEAAYRAACEEML